MKRSRETSDERFAFAEKQLSHRHISVQLNQLPTDADVVASHDR